MHAVHLQDTQKERLLRRLDRPDKHWKYNPGDPSARAKWDAYREACMPSIPLKRTHTDHAPWFVSASDQPAVPQPRRCGAVMDRFSADLTRTWNGQVAAEGRERPDLSNRPRRAGLHS